MPRLEQGDGEEEDGDDAADRDGPRLGMDVAPPREEGGDEDDVDDDGGERGREVMAHPVQRGAEDGGDADEGQVGEHDAEEGRHELGFRGRRAGRT
jgi:hypothetical protein